MKIKIFLIFLLLPGFLFSQEKNNKKKDKSKVNSYSGATYYSAKKGKVEGYAKDKVTNSPLEFASVSIVKNETQKIIEGTITDENGKFKFEDLRLGEYFIEISFIGYEKLKIDINLSESNPNYFNENILINQDSKLLSEITIEEKKVLYETKVDKIVYNAENDLNETEESAVDVLRKTPLLSVDIEGNVSLNGSRKIKFLVNGKESSFFTGDISTALQMIPADQIKTIEVITSPGAKYDGDGDAGIVNIITKKKKIDGYQAIIKGSIGNKSTNSGLNLNLGKDNWGLSVNGGSWGSGFVKREGTDSYYRINWNEDSTETNILSRNGTSQSLYNGYRGSVNAFYDIDTLNSINSSFNLSGRTRPSDLSVTSLYTKYNQATDTTTYDTEKTDRTLKMELTTDYTKRFKDNENKLFSIAFQIGGNINDGNTSIIQLDSNLFNQNDEKSFEQTIQIDYTLPFGNNRQKNKKLNKTLTSKKRLKYNKSQSISGENKVEFGGKFINRDREIIYSDMLNDQYLMSEEFNYNQRVSSSYLSSEFSFKKGIGIKAGLRWENTIVKGDWKNESQEPFENTYNNILPSFILSKSFSPMQSIKLSYNQRITRPSIREINTNYDRTDNFNQTIGNPQLEPTVTEKIELGINSFGRLLQGSFQVYHKYSSNVIESFLEINEEGNSISKYQNIGETKQNGIGFFGSINFYKFSFRSGINLFNYSGRDINLGYENWSEPVTLYSYNFSGNISFGNNWQAETFAFYRSPSQTIQGNSTSFSMMSIGIKKVFSNKRGSIGLRVIEPFSKNKIFTTDLSGENFQQTSVRSIPFRSLSLSFRYTFGKINFKKGTKNSKIKNDDIQNQSDSQY